MVASRVSTCAITAFFFLSLSPLLCLAKHGLRFRGSGADDYISAIKRDAVETSVQDSLRMVVQGGGSDAARRLSVIEASVLHTFQAMPKNPMGRLAPRSVRHMVHSFFAKEHGWLIKGLEPHGMQADISEVHGITILQDKAPALVEALLEARHAGNGLSLADIVVMVAALEKLIFDESISLLESAYFLNHHSSSDHLEAEDLHEVLTSYLLLFEIGSRGNLSDPHLHQEMKYDIAHSGGNWDDLVEFEQDAVWSYLYNSRNSISPFAQGKFTFEAAATIVEAIAQNYGKWQNLECQQMKEDLMSVDLQGTGLVPFSVFYTREDTAEYQFTESVDYLREIGAVDLSPTGGRRPKVRIANYLAGPSNCIGSHMYYSVCCLSECEKWMNELEGKVQTPSASVEHLLNLVANLTSADFSPQPISLQLTERLYAIGQHHGGLVPLHGRLFAQWLHYAFPRDCPYPHTVEDAAVLTPGHWIGPGKRVVSDPVERQKHLDQAEDHTVALSEPTVHEWSHDEVLPLKELEDSERGAFGHAVRVVMQLLMLLCTIRAVAAVFNIAASTLRKKVGNLKNKYWAFTLPTSVSRNSSALFF